MPLRHWPGRLLRNASNFGGDRANTSVTASMNQGLFNNTLAVAAKDENVSIYHRANAALALLGSSNAFAGDSDGNNAKSSVNATMSEGRFDTVMSLEADGSAIIYQRTNATEALTAAAVTNASNFEGDRANTSVTASMNQGLFNNTMAMAARDENVSIYHRAKATLALSGSSKAFAEDSDGNKAKATVNATMAGGLFDTVMNLEADGSAAIYQRTDATKALTGAAISNASNFEGDRANTSVTAGMNQGLFNNTLAMVARDENVSIYHRSNATLALSASSGALADDGSGNKTGASSAVTMNSGLFNTTMMLEADDGSSLYQYLDATRVLQGTDRSYAEDGNSHHANTSVSVNNGGFINELMARALGLVAIEHDWIAGGDSINAAVHAEKPAEWSYIDTTVTKNTANPATLIGSQIAKSNNTGTQTDQFIQARGRIASEIRSSSNGLTSNSDLNYNSVGVDAHLWAATNALGAYSDRWTIFYLDDDVGDETIQSSVDEAFDHPVNYDTIRVFEGEYRENVKVDKSLYIIGNGTDKTIVDGEKKGRVFEVGLIDPTKNVTISYMTIWNGSAPTDVFGDAKGGAIYNKANLTLIGANVTGSIARGLNASEIAIYTGKAGSAYGGGIYNENNLTLIATNVFGNQAIGGDAVGKEHHRSGRKRCQLRKYSC